MCFWLKCTRQRHVCARCGCDVIIQSVSLDVIIISRLRRIRVEFETKVDLRRDISSNVRFDRYPVVPRFVAVYRLDSYVWIAKSRAIFRILVGILVSETKQSGVSRHRPMLRRNVVTFRSRHTARSISVSRVYLTLSRVVSFHDSSTLRVIIARVSSRGIIIGVVSSRSAQMIRRNPDSRTIG